MFKVMLVDDYEMNLEILEAYLRRSELPLEIYTAMDGQGAMRILHERSIDIALLDVMLPDISGIELCRVIKEYGSEYSCGFGDGAQRKAKFA